MKQKDKLLRLVRRNPGLTATGYTRLLGFPPNNNYIRDVNGEIICNTIYKPASILKELHRFTEKGLLRRVEGVGMLRGKAWRFWPVEAFDLDF